MTGCVLIRSLTKKTAHASEQERVDVRAKRRRWRKRQDWLKHHLHLLGRIVFIDETGLNTKWPGFECHSSVNNEIPQTGVFSGRF